MKTDRTVKTHRSIRPTGAWIQLACLAFYAGVLAGCAVGPDFKRPEPPPVSGYTATVLPEQTASAPGSLG